MNLDEQWKGDGNCRICRKRNYCKTECGASRRQRDRMTRLFSRRIMSAAIFRGQEKTQNRDTLREAARETCTPYTEKSLDAICERLKRLAANSPFTVNALTALAADIVRECGMTLEDAVIKVEHEVQEAVQKGASER